MRTDFQCRRFGPHFFFHFARTYRRDCAAPAARFLSLPRFFASLLRTCLSCKRLGPHFLFRLAEKENGRRRPKEKGRSLWSGQRFHSTGFFLAAVSACRASSEGRCAFPDAQPLTLAVCAAWRRHCRFHSMQLNEENVENLLNRPALLRRTTRDSARPPGLPG